jgi:VIT1/CCC1 family predicted Fe2+/Mn2+ transporter
MPPLSHHRAHRTSWLRAAVLGANDGIISTGSLLVGMSAAHASHSNLLLAAVAALAAGTMSMAAGEYVSVSSQADVEEADLRLERRGLETDPPGEHAELSAIYEARGLTPELARQVASQLMARDALAAHARDELGITDTMRARPLQAALASGVSFSAGALLPLLVILFATPSPLIICAASLACLAVLGAAAARIGGASMLTGARRVLVWGSLAMAITAAIGRLLDGVA